MDLVSGKEMVMIQGKIKRRRWKEFKAWMAMDNHDLEEDDEESIIS